MTNLLVLLLAGCGGQSGENPLQPDGPRIDFTTRVDEVGAVFDGTRDGVVEDAGGATPCAIADATFVLTTEVGAPRGCTDHDDTTANTCTSATEAGFAFAGSLDFGDGAPAAFDGSIGVWSEPEGLALFKSTLTAPASEYPNQGLDLLVDGRLLDEARFRGLTWNRTYTPEDAAEDPAWELCTLSFTE